MALEWTCHKEGMLRKSHRGASSILNPRYFVSDGFHVEYFESEAMKKRNGRFDLRNVLSLRPAADMYNAIEFVLAEGSKSKSIIVSFQSEPSEKPRWLQLWCSAVEAANVDPALIEFRHESLAEKFNYEFSDKAALVSSVLKKSNSVLTPRRASAAPPKPPAADVAQKASMLPTTNQEALDTPRDAASAAPLAPNIAAPPAPSTPGAYKPSPPSTPLPSMPPPVNLPTSTADDEDTFQITVPDGVNPGDKLKATTPNGVKVLLRVPEGAGPGTELNFTLPKGTTTSKAASEETAQAVAATKIQAQIRGKTVRNSITPRPNSEPPKPKAKTELSDGATEEELVWAATRLQSAVRGHAVRYEQEEVRRVEWMKYYMQPDVAQYDKALELTCTPEEEAVVEDAKQENSRVQWLEYFVADGKLNEARELGWDGKNPPPPSGSTSGDFCGVLAKCFGGSKAAVEGARNVDFIKAVRAYDWDLASALAATHEEMMDVADSKNRVEWMEHHLSQGDRTQALSYAITSEERIRIESLDALVKAS